MLFYVAPPICHGDMTSSPKLGKLFAAMLVFSAHLKQKAAKFPPGEFRRFSDVHCRGDNHTGEWQIAGEGVAVAREERRKLREWGADEILSGCTARLVPPSFESQGRWGRIGIVELERLARLKGGLMAGSPIEAANVATASLARWRLWFSVVLQRGNAAKDSPARVAGPDSSAL